MGVEIEFINMLKSDKFNFHSGVEINDSTTFKELGFDSLDEVEFVMALEEKFAIAITDEEVTNCRTVGQAIDESYLKNEKNPKINFWVFFIYQMCLLIGIFL